MSAVGVRALQVSLWQLTHTAAAISGSSCVQGRRHPHVDARDFCVIAMPRRARSSAVKICGARPAGTGRAARAHSPNVHSRRARGLAILGACSIIDTPSPTSVGAAMRNESANRESVRCGTTDSAAQVSRDSRAGGWVQSLAGTIVILTDARRCQSAMTRCTALYRVVLASSGCVRVASFPSRNRETGGEKARRPKFKCTSRLPPSCRSLSLGECVFSRARASQTLGGDRRHRTGNWIRRLRLGYPNTGHEPCKKLVVG